MRQNATIEVRANGLIVAVGNQPLNVRDSGNAIGRRIRPFETKRISSSRVPLIQRTGFNTFKGVLRDEAPAIFNWMLDVDSKDYEVVNDPERYVPSFKELQAETSKTLNPLKEWIEEELLIQPDSATPLGGYATTKRLEAVGVERMFLYPRYVNWCKRMGTKPYANKRFSNELLSTCQAMKIPVERGRRETGTFFFGVAINPKVRDLRYQIGDCRDSQGEEGVQADQPVPCADTHKGVERNQVTKFLVQTPNPPHSALDPNLYENYIKLLLVPSLEREKLEVSLRAQAKESQNP